MDLNLQTTEIITKCLGMKIEILQAEEYHINPKQTDFRSLVNGKKDTHLFETYPQVFKEKFEFINNLSVLDLLFNEGRHALTYLKEQKL
jgi:hypothetical protein